MEAARALGRSIRGARRKPFRKKYARGRQRARASLINTALYNARRMSDCNGASSVFHSTRREKDSEPW